ncbi:nitrogen regulation protein NR(I) [SAR86 cluster bacterium]|jgi:two-component system nitrogen regulation response regulator GlnG|nr:nitrogen regulation protein NR(I) [SAR86 cluster bacterium]MEC9193052.1 nitrogen regulation protein NR(I) [Pseudomonadota bacterium]|tara:strand:- start:216 stop:1613 length:1398 start_codon:yes stop_codon:yes gene_type:complete
MPRPKKVWIADDDESIRFILEKGLIDAGFHVNVFEDGNEVVNHLEIEKPHVLLTDLKMPGRDGMDLLDTFKNEYPNIPVIMMTAHSDLDTTVEAFESGAWDYIAKPFDLNGAIDKITKALSEKKKNQKISSSKEEIDLKSGKLIGKSNVMQDLFNSIGKLSHSNSTVLLYGESGTGKELVARAIYEHSDRQKKKLISLNMADIPIELLESELFGYEKGAFTGASQKKLGRFEQAHEGTLFLDEIGDMPFETQTRILRVLSSGEFYRIGGTDPVKVDVRIIAATNQNLNDKVKSGAFREDLFHRLNVIRIALPPLRERKEDIPLLANYFLNKYSDELKSEPKILSSEVEELFRHLIWPGNVLQLQNLCHSLTVLSSAQEIVMSDLPNDLIIQKKGPDLTWNDMLETWASKELLNGEDHILNSTVPIFEKTLIKVALKASKGKKSEAAKLLGWGRNTLARKMQELDF